MPVPFPEALFLDDDPIDRERSVHVGKVRYRAVGAEIRVDERDVEAILRFFPVGGIEGIASIAVREDHDVVLAEPRGDVVLELHADAGRVVLRLAQLPGRRSRRHDARRLRQLLPFQRT